MRNLSQNAHPEPATTLTSRKDDPLYRCPFRSIRSLCSSACSVPLTSLERSGGEFTCSSAHNLPDDSRGEEPSIHRDTLARNISGRGKAEECNQPGHLFRFSDTAKRRLAYDAASGAFIRQKALSQIRFDEPRSD